MQLLKRILKSPTKQTLKRIGFFALGTIAIPVLYLLIAWITSNVTIDRVPTSGPLDNTIYLSSNGVHLDIILPINEMDGELLNGLERKDSDDYLAFGWGDENFYLNTPTWSALTFNTAFSALFLKSPTLMHVTRYRQPSEGCISIPITETERQKLNAYIQRSFKLDQAGNKVLLEGRSYGSKDAFYRANGSYSCFKTCNTWANTAFKESGLKAALWTPFDFGLLGNYE